MSFTTRLIRSLLLCALFCASSLVSFTHALGAKFNSPAPGATLPPGQFTVSWEDAGGTPGLSNLTTYNLALWVGGNTASNSKPIITSLGTPDASVQSLSLVVDVPTDIAQSIQNGFYLCMTSNTSTGNQVINYSNRFTLINLNGTTDQQYVAGAASTVGDANVPSAYYNNTIATPPPPSTTTTSSTTTTPTASETPSSGSSSSDDQGYTIGGGALVGLLVGTLSAIILLLVLLTLGLIWWRRRRRARREQEKEEEQTDAEIWAGDRIAGS